MPMKDLADVFDPDLRLPIRGKTYTVPAPTAEVGLRLAALSAIADATAATDGDTLAAAAEALQLDDGDELDFHKDCLGTAYQQMLDDKLPYAYIEHAAATAFLYWTKGADAGEWYWNAGGKATPSLAAPTPDSDSTAAASTTSTPASTSGTTSRPKSQNGTTKKARAKKASPSPAS